MFIERVRGTDMVYPSNDLVDTLSSNTPMKSPIEINLLREKKRKLEREQHELNKDNVQKSASYRNKQKVKEKGIKAALLPDFYR